MFISGFLMTQNEQMTFFRAMENLQLKQFKTFFLNILLLDASLFEQTCLEVISKIIN